MTSAHCQMLIDSLLQQLLPGTDHGVLRASTGLLLKCVCAFALHAKIFPGNCKLISTTASLNLLLRVHKKEDVRRLVSALERCLDLHFQLRKERKTGKRKEKRKKE